MGYYIRVLGTRDPNIHLDELINSLSEDGLTAKFSLEDGSAPDNWTLIEVRNEKGDTLTQIERNPVVEGELGLDELNEFRESIQEYKPLTAVEWLTNYFHKVTVIYAFQMLDAAFENDNFQICSTIKDKIWNRTAGIIQADNEGFSNDQGFHILWQFSENAKGEWSCAVRNPYGTWDNFIMDLGDVTQREEFQNGKIPNNAKRI